MAALQLVPVGGYDMAWRVTASSFAELLPLLCGRVLHCKRNVLHCLCVNKPRYGRLPDAHDAAVLVGNAVDSANISQVTKALRRP
jgi:hypothetical protein